MAGTVMRKTLQFTLFAASLFVAVVLITAQSSQTPTFTKDVAPILYENCVTCHRPGEMAPMSLLTYDQARPFARAISQRVGLGTMPPWHAEGPTGVFSNERKLTPAEKDVLTRWAANGAPQGDPKDLPSPPVFPEGWTIGTPDAIVSMPQPYNVPASGTINYQYFSAPTNFTEDKWIQAITQQIAGDAGPLAQALAAGAQRERVQRGPLIATTAPGTNAQIFGPSSALRIKAGSVLTLQVHYTATGKPESDRTSVGFVFAKQAPKQEVRSASFINVQLRIPPGAENHRVDSLIEFNQDAHIVALFPHTHLRGKSWEYRLTYPDGREEVVLDVPRYDFNWQTYYQYAKPLAVPKGSRLLAIAHYDNSKNNKANPDPNVEVRWGDQTWQEMQYSGITYTVD
jgi:hypothetical protein